HRWKVVAPVLAMDARRERTAHREPVDDFGALEAAELRVFGDRHRGKLLGVALEEIEEPAVPCRVVESGALAVHLMRQSSGGADRTAQILGIALYRSPQRLPELVEAPGTRDRELQHAELQRNEPQRPLGLVRTQHRERREDAVVERAMLEERHVELVGHQR